MEQILTLVRKIQPSDDERVHLEETSRAFADACAYMHAIIPARITNVMRMQAILYYDVCGRFGLSSSLAQQAFRRVAANRKAARTQGEAVTTFKTTSIQYDQRIFACTERDWTVSLTLQQTNAALALEDLTGRTICVDQQQNIFAGHRGDTQLSAVPNPPEEQAYYRVEEEFTNAIRGKEEITMVPFETGVHYMEWTEAVIRSAQTG